jgi:hypothetical protein
MGKTQYKRAREFLDKLKGEIGEEVKFELFLLEMRKELGADEKRTIKPYMQLMRDLTMVKEEGGLVIIK